MPPWLVDWRHLMRGDEFIPSAFVRLLPCCRYAGVAAIGPGAHSTRTMSPFWAPLSFGRRSFGVPNAFRWVRHPIPVAAELVEPGESETKEEWWAVQSSAA
jgi:hypothetical protein